MHTAWLHYIDGIHYNAIILARSAILAKQVPFCELISHHQILYRDIFNNHIHYLNKVYVNEILQYHTANRFVRVQTML